MNKKDLLIFIAIIMGVFAYSYGMFSAGAECKEKELAQELCRYAEYDFCKVESYIIKIKKGK